MLARGDAKAEIAQDRLVRPIGERDVLKDHLATRIPGCSQRPGLSGGWRSLAVGDLQGLFKEFTDPFDGGESPLDLGEAFRELPQRVEKLLGIEDEGGEGSETHGTSGDHPTAEGKDHCHGTERHPFDEGRDAAVEEDRSIHSPAVSKPCGVEAVTIDGFTAEHLNHLQPLQVLLKVSVELGQLLPHPIVSFAITTLKPEDDQRHGNLHDQQQHAEAPLHKKHRHSNHGQADQVAENPDCTAAEDLGKGVDITGEPRQELADGHAVMEPDRQIDRMGKQILANARRQPLTDCLDVEELNSLKGQPQEH